jgi:hypothetical protein
LATPGRSDYFAAAGAIGLLSTQLQEPDPEWAAEWAVDFGERMATAARRRRQERLKSKADRKAKKTEGNVPAPDDDGNE